MAANWPVVCRALRRYRMDDRLTCIGAIGTIAIETASTFAPVREAYWLPPAQREAYYADTTKHAPYAGGTRYHGRGYIQTTHSYNYERVGRELGLDLLSEPDRLLEPWPAAVALATYFRDRGIPAICQRRDWAGVRRAVYGGADPAGAARIARAADLLLS